MKGKLFIVSGPSGSGKSTVTKLVKDRLNIPLSISATTRKPRNGEIDGKDYFFLTKETFEQKIKNDEFYEYANVHGNYYGTLKEVVESNLNKGLNVILEIDVQGALIAKEKKKDAVLVFFRTKDMETLEKRLRNRNTDTEEVIQTRLKNALKELEYEKKYDYTIINNDIYRGSHDGAGEVGHMSILPEGINCPCGSKGCFELYASGTAINERMKADMIAGKKSLAFELADYDPDKIEGSLLLEAASKNDEYALEAYKLEGYYLGLGIANLLNILDTEAIVLGGGVTKAKEYFHQSCISTLKERCVHRVDEGMLRYSKLNDSVVLYGAYYLCKDKEI